jgi:hypothetical protein
LSLDWKDFDFFFFLDCKIISNLVKAKKEWCDLQTWMSCHKILRYSSGKFCSSPCISSKYRSKKRGLKKKPYFLFLQFFCVVDWNKGSIQTTIFLYTSYFVYTFYIKKFQERKYTSYYVYFHAWNFTLPIS